MPNFFLLNIFFCFLIVIIPIFMQRTSYQSIDETKFKKYKIAHTKHTLHNCKKLYNAFESIFSSFFLLKNLPKTLDDALMKTDIIKYTYAIVALLFF